MPDNRQDNRTVKRIVIVITIKWTGALTTMRILQLVKWLSPWEDTGGKIRSFALGRALASFARVDAAGFMLPGEQPAGNENHLVHYGQLYALPVCRGAEALRQLAAAAAGGLSLRTARFFPGFFASFVEKILRDTAYDAVQVEELPLMSSLRSLDAKLPVIYSSHNLESELSRRLFEQRGPLFKLAAKWEYQRTVAEERSALSRSHAVLVVSERDRKALIGLSPDSAGSLYVLPNCAQDRFQPSGREKSGQEILAVGAWGWYPNQEGLLWFVNCVLPLLRKDSPAVTVRVVGSGMGADFRRTLIRQGIEVHADVADTLPFFQQARLLFVPLRIGGGTRIKILEAWAAGLPVVSTPLGAEGLPCRSGTDVLIAGEAAEFAAAVRQLLHDDALYAKLRRAGLQQSLQFRWSSLEAPLRQVYEPWLKSR